MAIPEFYLKEIDQGGALVGLLIGLVVAGTGFVTGMVYAIVVGVLQRFAGEAGLARPDVFFCGPVALARELTGTCQSLGLPFWFERF